MARLVQVFDVLALNTQSKASIGKETCTWWVDTSLYLKAYVI